ncbi:zinc finger CCCH domain-containing protein [Striga asiatica]|uniref:Zinc finger CCCH domain-containing protein n=1 Tax=Striga asiatica TaxID=4170 RepID=A0A5A7RFZ8_STRAF|nr:zinc finger CCCH domain-containing protein [Striga asiatica]
MMLMMGDPPPSNPTVQIPPWDYLEDPTAHIHSPALAALQRFLPSNKPEEEEDEISDGDFDFPADAFSCDDFRMFEFKVRACARVRSHDWTECPFAHPGEKARRRDPRRHHYSGSPCPDFRRGACRRGDSCDYAHGVFECWLHPARYRTQPCKDGIHCRRRVCFFAHTPEQLRVFPLTGSANGSPRHPEPDPFVLLGSSPRSTPPGESLKLSQLTETMRGLQISNMRIGLGPGLSTTSGSWGLGFDSLSCPLETRSGFISLPSTPVRVVTRSGLSPLDTWEASCQEEPTMERVESGKALREKIYQKIGQENSLDRIGRVESVSGVPIFGGFRSL